jgi:carbamoyltransferase
MSRLVLGINSAHADSSAVLVGENGIIAAIAEERMNRKKHCAGFPAQAVAEVMRIGGATAKDLTDIAVARDPEANMAGKLAYVVRYPKSGVPRAVSRFQVHREVATTPELVAEALGSRATELGADFHNVEHHLAHVASAFYCSPFERATGISVDGAGDFATHMLARCEGLDVHVERRNLWPHSLGVLYTAVCQFIGFDRFGEEYKVMGLSAYGVNRYARELRELVRYDKKKGIRLNLRYFQHHRAASNMEILDDDEVRVARMYGESMRELFGQPRERGAAYTDRDNDLAASLQFRFEDVYAALVEDAVQRVDCRDAVFAGGSVLNSVGNGRVLTERLIDRAYYHPAASDDGTAAGAALYVMHGKHRVCRAPPLMHAYLGSSWSDAEVEQAVNASGLPFKRLDRGSLLETAATAIAGGKIIGWFHGREEWGPRALGNRSILCHPGWPDMKATLNARIKNREHFRPFAPAVLEEKLSTCFQGSHEVPFMIIVYKVRPEWKARLAAITHEDGTGRVQTVRRDQNELYYDLIQCFEKQTGVPVLLNTSFNENEPIVHTPEQAVDCFARTRMDALGIGSFWLEKAG